MKTRIKLNKDSDTGELYFDLKDVLEGTGVPESSVSFYELEEKGEALILTLYDKDKRIININKGISNE